MSVIESRESVCSCSECGCVIDISDCVCHRWYVSVLLCNMWMRKGDRGLMGVGVQYVCACYRK